MIENISMGLVLDIVILVLLVATIAYAIRLTGYLKRFKQSRSELENVIKDLAKYITKADHAMEGLNRAVETSSDDLNDRMNRANKMFDELEIVIQTGDALANRLENLAVRNRKIIEGGEGDVADLMRRSMADENAHDTRHKSVVKKVEAHVEQEPVRSTFAIRDPEMERGDTEGYDGFTIDDGEYLSDAERDLYEALQKKRGGK